MKKLVIAAALLLVLTALFMACGGGGDGAAAPVTVSLTDFQNAGVVVGQATFTRGSSNQGAAAAANTINSPYRKSLVLNGKLYLPD